MDSAKALQLSIDSVAPSYRPGESVKLHVIVHNVAEQAVTILIWDSPLDPKASALGVFQVREVGSGRVISGDAVKFARKLPAGREAYIEIEARQQTETWVTLPPLPLKAGKKYAVQTNGEWKGLWPQKIDVIGQDALDSLTGSSPSGFEGTSSEIFIT